MQVNQKKHASGAGRELLMCTLGSRGHGIDILKGPEICGYETVTTAASASEFTRGAINLNGIVVPVIDIRVKFRPDSVTCHETTHHHFQHRQPSRGRGGGQLSDVTALKAEIKPLPGFGSGRVKYLQGYGCADEREGIPRDTRQVTTRGMICWRSQR